MDYIDGLHNFYPRPHTGLDLDYFKAQTHLLHAYGLSVGAFVPSQSASGRRCMKACRHWKTTDIGMSAWLHAIWRP